RSVDELNPQLELQVNAFIPDAYVEDSSLKIEVYKRVAAAAEPADIDAIAAELQDRYGAPPLPVTLLLQVGRIKSLARKARVAQLQQKGEVLEMRFAADHKLSGEVLLYLASRWGKRVTFSEKKGFALLLKNGAASDQSGRLQVALELLQDLLTRLN
ncbi:MAG: transcription-repair coupling factor, partial [Firmicutes bacterium]|nr:transcription-repair coupling factor [Bacillota bacterium]